MLLLYLVYYQELVLILAVLLLLWLHSGDPAVADRAAVVVFSQSAEATQTEGEEGEAGSDGEPGEEGEEGERLSVLLVGGGDGG